MSFFDTSPNQEAAQRESMLRNPAVPEDLDAGVFQGIPAGAALGARGLNTLALGVFQAPYAAAQKYVGKALDPLLGTNLEADATAQQEYLRQRVAALRPDPQQIGWAGRTLAGLETILPAALVGGEIAGPEGAAAIVGAMSAHQGAMDALTMGVRPNVAAGMGLLSGATGAAGMYLPMSIPRATLLQNALFGASTNVMFGATERAATSTLLERSGYPDLAQQYKGIDAQGAIGDAVMGVAFGGLGWWHGREPAMDARDVNPALIDASIAAARERHATEASLPGIPTDADAIAAHTKALEQATGELYEDKPVTAETLAHNFDPLPAHPELEAGQASALAELSRLNARAAELGLPTEEAPAPVEFTPGGQMDIPRPVEGAADIAQSPAADRLTPDARAGLQIKYNEAAAGKPEFDQALEDIAQATGTTAVTAGLKSPKRAVEKIEADYAGDTSQIKDVLRGSIMIDTGDQAAGAVQAILDKFPGAVVKRNLFAEDAKQWPSGYVDALINVPVRGHMAEVQVHIPEVFDVKEHAAHALYEQQQAIERDARLQGRGMNEAEFARYKELDAEQAALYVPAIAAARKRSLDMLTPRLSAEAGNGLETPADQPSNLPSELDTGSPSTSQKTAVGENAGIAGASIGATPSSSSVPQAAKGLFDWTPGGGSRVAKMGKTELTYGVGSDGNTAQLILLKTPTKARGKGSAQAALDAFLADADARGVTVSLDAHPLDGKTDLARLRAFYERAGFEPAGGEKMVRPPQAPAEVQPTAAAFAPSGGFGNAGEVMVGEQFQPVRWALVDAGELNANTAKGAAQARDRTRASSDLQVAKIAANLDFRLLESSPLMDTGAPTLTRDGAVVGGNGRVLAINRAYELGTAGDYKARLATAAKQYGFDPAAVEAMQRPALVRVLSNDVNVREAAVASNEGGSARMSLLEQAPVDAARLPSLDNLAVPETGDLNAPANRPFIAQWVGRFPAGQQAALVDAAGALSQEGMIRLRNAILAKAYGDSPTLARLIESVDPAARNVGVALTRAGGAVAAARDAIAAGDLHPLDMTPELLQAVDRFAQAKAEGVKVADLQAQGSLLEAPLSPEASAILTFLDEHARSAKAVADFIGSFYRRLEAVGNPKNGSLLADAGIPTKVQLLKLAAKDVDGGSTSMLGLFDQEAAPLAREAAIAAKPDGWTAKAKRSDVTLLVSADLDDPTMWRITSISADGTPLGHEVFSAADVARNFMSRADPATIGNMLEQIEYPGTAEAPRSREGATLEAQSQVDQAAKDGELFQLAADCATRTGT